MNRTNRHIEALELLDKGWTPMRVAKKFKVTTSAVYNWKHRYGKDTQKTTTRLSKNGVMDTNTTTSTLMHKVTVNFDDNFFQQLLKLAEQEVRTPQDQVKYLVHQELVRHARNNTNIPF